MHVSLPFYIRSHSQYLYLFLKQDFEEGQRTAVLEAARTAGFQVPSVIIESTAAILAYDLHIGCTEPYALVYDFGGGGFTATVSRLEEDGAITIVNVQTERKYASRRMDETIATYLAKAHKRRTRKDILNRNTTMAKLKLEAEKAKMSLDARVSARVFIENVHEGEDLDELLTRSKLDELTGDLIWRTISLSEIALMKANYSSTQQKMLDDVAVSRIFFFLLQRRVMRAVFRSSLSVAPAAWLERKSFSRTISQGKN